MTALLAATAPQDATGVGTRRYNKALTRQAVLILERADASPHITQARNSFGSLGENGHGMACATQVLYEIMDSLRFDANKEISLNRVLPVTTSEIISWNDTEKLSFAGIAAKIRSAAGGALKLFQS